VCGVCRHARRITSDRGSSFILCELSRTDPAFPRYPRLPVVACPGFNPLSGSNEEGGSGTRAPNPFDDASADV
jgi:hypothetical protein